MHAGMVRKYLGLSLLTATLTICLILLMRQCARLPGDAVRAVRSAFENTLKVQPEIQVNQVTVIGQTTPIAELAVVTHQEMHEYTYTHQLTWLKYPLPHTEKTIYLRGVYRVKAGFNLKKPFHVSIQNNGQTIEAELPPAEILSVERVGNLTFHDEDTWLNRLSDQERQTILNQFDAYAREQANQSAIRQEAESQVQQRLTELLERNGRTFIFRLRR